MKLKSGKRWETNIGSEVRECLKKNQVGGEGSDEGAILDRVDLRLQKVGEAMQLWWEGDGENILGRGNSTCKGPEANAHGGVVGPAMRPCRKNTET